MKTGMHLICTFKNGSDMAGFYRGYFNFDDAILRVVGKGIKLDENINRNLV